jgi:carboxymethylenebutenolidase
MCDQDHFEQALEFERQGMVTRRQFGVLVAAGVALALPKVANAVAVTEMDVTIKTPDGTCDAYFVHPASGTAPGVLVWPDIFGLRPAFRTMGKRLAESGYSVLVVNPFYRQQKAPTASKGAATPIPELLPLAKPIQNSTTQLTDAKAFTAWLDQQASVAKNRKMGTQGYCMGGPMAFRTASASDRIGAIASFHGGGLVTMDADSPHTLASKTKASLLIAIAANDDMQRPMEKDILKETFMKSGQSAEVEVYTGAAHGWCPPDSGVYNEPQAEKAWSRLLALYGKALA